jgi:hypothetical protein
MIIQNPLTLNTPLTFAGLSPNNVTKSSKFDLCILVPGIRTTRWKTFYDSILKSCRKYSWQLILVSPFDLPDELKDKLNITLIKDTGNVSRCTQRGVLEAKSDLVYITTDDSVMCENAIDMAVDKFKKTCGYKDVMGMLYKESGVVNGPDNWIAGKHDALKIPGIPPHYNMTPQPLMHRKYFIEMGGLDCLNFQYSNQALNDLMFRIQYDGGKLCFSPTHVNVATAFPNLSGDHRPVHRAEINHDGPNLIKLYQDTDALSKRGKIDFDNWKQTSEVWELRFKKGVPKNYNELCEQEGYILFGKDNIGI